MQGTGIVTEMEDLCSNWEFSNYGTFNPLLLWTLACDVMHTAWVFVTGHIIIVPLMFVHINCFWIKHRLTSVTAGLHKKGEAPNTQLMKGLTLYHFSERSHINKLLDYFIKKISSDKYRKKYKVFSGVWSKSMNRQNLHTSAYFC